MAIKGLEGLSTEQVSRELERGARFVCYDFCISLLVVTFRRSSGLYFIRGNESALVPGLKYSLLTLLLGWWGIPWGPIYSVGSLAKNFSGGRDVTGAVLEQAQGE
jgi:hypothetical protein